MTPIKWKRHSTGVIAADIGNDLMAWVYVTQFGTFTSTRRYQWQIRRGPDAFGKIVHGGGSHLSQRIAKADAEAFINRKVAA